jgi:hypothetical protein
MEERKMGKFRLEIKWGLAFTAMVAFWMGMENAAGLHDRHIDKHAYYTSLILVPAVAIYLLALLDVRKSRYGGAMSYAQGIRYGLGLTAVIVLLSPLNQALVSFVLSPSYFENAIRLSVDKGFLDLESARSRFTFGSYLVQGAIGGLVTGAFMTAVLAAFTRGRRRSLAAGA